jgi:hypothetical protein
VHQRRRTGGQVLWNGYTGTFLRDTIEGPAEVLGTVRVANFPVCVTQSLIVEVINLLKR